MMWTETRHPSFPNVPTLRELGYPFDIEVPMGIVGPKNMDATVVTVLHNAFRKARDDLAVGALIEKFDLVPRYASGDDFARRWRPLRRARSRSSSTRRGWRERSDGIRVGGHAVWAGPRRRNACQRTAASGTRLKSSAPQRFRQLSEGLLPCRRGDRHASS